MSLSSRYEPNIVRRTYVYGRMLNVLELCITSRIRVYFTSYSEIGVPTACYHSSKIIYTTEAMEKHNI